MPNQFCAQKEYMGWEVSEIEMPNRKLAIKKAGCCSGLQKYYANTCAQCTRSWNALRWLCHCPCGVIRDTFFIEHLAEFALFKHLADDIAAALKFAFDVKLRDRWPV